MIRNELTELEQCLAVDRRKEIYEARWPEAKRGSAPGAGRGKGKKKIEERHDGALPKSFSSDTASKTDKSIRTTQRQAKIGAALKDIAEEVAATPIADNQKEMLALAKLPEKEQRQVVADLTSGKAKSVKQAHRQQTAVGLKLASPLLAPQNP